METRIRLILLALLLSVLVLGGCDAENEDSYSSLTQVEDGTGETATIDPENGSESLVYSHDLGSTPQDVYFIFTNTTSSDISTSNIDSSLHSEDRSLHSDRMNAMEGSQVDLTTWAREHGVGLRGKPEVTAFNVNLPVMARRVQPPRFQMAVPEPRRAVVAGTTTNSFMNESATDTITATARAVVTDGVVTLNIWVADDSWGSCAKHYCMDQDMVNAFADKFLQAGADNDIYDWVSNIYGSPWGSHSFADDLIVSSANSEIDILFFDIDDDGNNATDDDPDGGVLGFFWAKDNYLASSISYSNQRLLFYMDSVLTAKEEDSSWEISDYWPAEMVSTLAHEFQHMIHFYQKNVTYNVSSETWINEMASMIAEDLLADKMSVNGPRGIAYDDDSAGSPGNSEGRLPLFNYYNYVGPTVWFSGNSALINYAVNYSFGAYLARNYGGAELFRKMVQSGETNYKAITTSVEDMGYSGETFASLLQKWGIAVLWSDLTDRDNGFRYNTGGGFTSTLDGVTYSLGSVDLFNYDYGSLSGPFLYTPSSLSGLSRHYKYSNTYVKMGTAETGTFEATIDMKEGLTLTVVTKESN